MNAIYSIPTKTQEFYNNFKMPSLSEIGTKIKQVALRVIANIAQLFQSMYTYVHSYCFSPVTPPPAKPPTDPVNETPPAKPLANPVDEVPPVKPTVIESNTTSEVTPLTTLPIFSTDTIDALTIYLSAKQISSGQKQPLQASRRMSSATGSQLSGEVKKYTDAKTHIDGLSAFTVLECIACTENLRTLLSTCALDKMGEIKRLNEKLSQEASNKDTCNAAAITVMKALGLQEETTQNSIVHSLQKHDARSILDLIATNTKTVSAI